MVAAAHPRGHPRTTGWIRPVSAFHSKKRVLASHLGKIALLSRDDLDVGTSSTISTPRTKPAMTNLDARLTYLKAVPFGQEESEQEASIA